VGHFWLSSTRSDPHFQINLDSDLDVCQNVAPKMLWIHYLVDTSHLAKCHENRPANV